VLALLAHLEGNPVGYKIGYRFSPGRYHSWAGGVLADYRRSGVARRMQEWQHGWCRSRGYHHVQFNSFNKFKEMLLFGLSSGFLPVGVELRPEKEISIKFEKDLRLPEPAERPRPTAKERLQVESHVSDAKGLRLKTVQMNVRYDDPALIAACLKEGFELTGAIYESRPGTLMVRLERNI
jgi:hypothetical protein